MTPARSSYKLAMTVETLLLSALVASLPLTYYGGKPMFAAWVWAIYFTFPGTYAMQPAVTTQVRTTKKLLDKIRML